MTNGVASTARHRRCAVAQDTGDDARTPPQVDECAPVRPYLVIGVPQKRERWPDLTGWLARQHPALGMRVVGRGSSYAASPLRRPTPSKSASNAIRDGDALAAGTTTFRLGVALLHEVDDSEMRSVRRWPFAITHGQHAVARGGCRSGWSSILLTAKPAPVSGRGAVANERRRRRCGASVASAPSMSACCGRWRSACRRRPSRPRLSAAGCPA